MHKRKELPENTILPKTGLSQKYFKTEVVKLFSKSIQYDMEMQSLFTIKLVFCKNMHSTSYVCFNKQRTGFIQNMYIYKIAC